MVYHPAINQKLCVEPKVEHKNSKKNYMIRLPHLGKGDYPKTQTQNLATFYWMSTALIAKGDKHTMQYKRNCLA
jgi:hypothetical protein